MPPEADLEEENAVIMITLKNLKDLIKAQPHAIHGPLDQLMATKTIFFNCHQFGHHSAESPECDNATAIPMEEFHSFAVLHESTSESSSSMDYNYMTDEEEDHNLTEYLNT